VRHVPDFPTLAEQPDPALTGTIVYSGWTDDGSCTWLADLGSEPRQLWCGEDPNAPFGYAAWHGFDETGNLLVASYEVGPGTEGSTLFTVDPETLQVIAERPIDTSERPPDLTVRDDGARAAVSPGDDDGSWEVQVVADGATRTVMTASGPDDYSMWGAQWSPDGRTIVVFDSERRAIAVAADGEPNPRVIATNADQLAWYQPAG
jgi:DNA-binding beta-propeller fold protein YncE